MGRPQLKFWGTVPPAPAKSPTICIDVTWSRDCVDGNYWLTWLAPSVCLGPPVPGCDLPGAGEFDPHFCTVCRPQAGLEKISGRLSNNCGLNSAKPQISGRRRLNKNPAG